MNTKTTATVQNKVKPLVRTVAFVLLFGLLFTFVSYLFRPSQNIEEQDGFYQFYAEPRNTLDVVYIGGSVCILSWAPYIAWKETGICSYAFGVSQLLPTAYIPMIKEVYKRQSPELFVFDLRPFQYGGDYCYTDVEVRKTSDWLPYSWNRFVFVKDALSHFPAGTLTDAPSYYLDLIKYHGEWQYLTENSFQYSWYGTSLCPTKGFAFVERCQEQTLADYSRVTKTDSPTELAETALRELLTFLQENQQEAIFVVTPYAEEEGHRMRYNYLRKILESEGFAYWNANDYRQEIGIDGTMDFYDHNHMNLFGAEKYTTYFSHYIDSRYALPDRRNDPAYADWSTGYETWCALASDCKREITAYVKKATASENVD